MDLKAQIDLKNLPQHIAIIMDGNGRWAKAQGHKRIFGHKNGVLAVRETCEASAELGIKHLTLYAFSMENWSRPKAEVLALMELLVHTIRKETKTLMDNGIRLQTIGKIEELPSRTLKNLNEAIKITEHNDRMDLVLALSYGSKWEILESIRSIAKEVKAGSIQPDEINEEVFSSYLTTKGTPDPELLIRTSGEQRISNFLLWQIAYSELYFTPTLWPDFRKDDLYKAILSYQGRERRFGKISEQISSL